MTFEEWHHIQLGGDKDNCSHEGWERKAWNAAIELAARVCEARGDKIGGTIDPHIMAADIRKCSSSVTLVLVKGE